VAVAAANRLTARWADSWDGDGTVLSGVGAWPLLAALAEAASGAARDELAEAVGVPAQSGLDGAQDLLQVLQESPAVRSALGLWTAASLPVKPEWASRLPDAVHGVLDADPKRSQAALDSWVEKQTDGLLRHLPVTVMPYTLLVLASALTVRTGWDSRFTSVPAFPADGPWARRRLSGLRRDIAVSDVHVVAGSDDGPVTLATVRGGDEIDVALVLGEPGARAGRVLARAVESVGASHADGGGGVRLEAVDLERDRPGPGLTVSEIPARFPAPTASLNTVAFTVNAHHDLLEHAELFGLRTATNGDQGRFPGISDVPLYVSAAAQDATATFSAEGFVAAAVTAISMARSAAVLREPEGTAKHLTASFDRPFGFLAIHRPSDLVLACGWVTNPDEYPA
jgi:hypothetical protein